MSVLARFFRYLPSPLGEGARRAEEVLNLILIFNSAFLILNSALKKSAEADFLLFSAEKSVTGVTQSGENIAVFVELFVQHRYKDFYVLVRTGKLFYALWRRDY